MRKLVGLVFLVVFLLIAFFNRGLSLYTDWLWFQEVDFTHVFTTILTFKLLLAVVFGGLFAALIFFNVKLAAQRPWDIPFADEDNVLQLPIPELIHPLLQRLLLPVALIIGLLCALMAAGAWESFLLFLNAVPFGLKDPLFDRDIGFYVFRLPALTSLYNWLNITLGITLVATAFTYLLYRKIRYSPRGLFLDGQAKIHISILFAVLLVIKAGGYVLDAYDLLYSPTGAAFGASYADVFASLPVLRAMSFLALAAAGLSIFQIFRPGFRYLIIGVGALIVVHILGLNFYPSLVQRFMVVPNEIDAEREFIKRNIEFTRRAYGLDKVEAQEFPAEEQLTARDIERNAPTIKNIRLWEPQPLLATLSQLQEIRTYYKFVDVDNDRYMVDGTYRQTMLSARELSHEHLPSRIWINEHLIYTHGYGVVFGPVNQVTPEGLPEFFIKDIPPVSSDSVVVTRPEIYFGEKANDYVFVKTKAQELDYPAGDQNVYTTYDGVGGVPIRSFWRKLLFSARYGTLKISLSNDITNESRILYYRQVHERVQKIAPFLTFDHDAYLVIAQGGRLFWVIDGYTTTARYPYSAPTGRMGNYIRNSVKTVVDAYNGKVSFYISSLDDPIIRAYGKIFPNLFQPLEAMPEDIRSHVRYPQDLFAVQARMYATYHMQDPQVFYNKEDLLSIPRKAAYAGEPEQVPPIGRVQPEAAEKETAPYYTIMRLPGEKKEEFVLLLPFTPNKKDNMRAWLAARSDPPNYGKLIALDFPKAKLVYGPRQIDARIDQDAYISQQLSLWGQRGSQVIRGNLLAIPIEKSLLYVQPLYLAAAKGSLPELKRVITAFGNQIAMEETLEGSLQKLFVGRVAAGPTLQEAALPEKGKDVRALSERIRELYRRSQELLRQGNEELRKIEPLLEEMQKGR